ncbi:MAG: type II toxin-antitoxin system RelB/DinJ family antitoxin [Bacteroides sp.]|nr:type II toxin-antitoxin system RelB/DinJ family antitoxin [Prevotella sp.]MCM1408728.1 type II toxin-antitoxin system RelB/DinJ family antitoxin [Treponema brennaborense]MCM1470643.1 type II toxin-antitoxin system RelB/DinJ family antitoxin [Bacteroides sp.]
MASVSTNIRIDEDVKAEASQLFEGLGLTLSDAVNVFLRQAILHRGIPFKVEYPEEKPNRATIRAMKEGDRFLAKYAKNPEKYKKNPKKYGLYDNVEELFEDMKKW